MGWINFHRVGNKEEPETRFKVKIMVFTEGTVISLPNLLSLYNHESYVPNAYDRKLDKTLEEIYKKRPKLNGITSEQGYIYNEFVQRNSIVSAF